MASYIIHTIAGERFLKKVEEKYHKKLTYIDRKNFLLGNLIVDSRKRNVNIPPNATEEERKEAKAKQKEQMVQEKIATHFRDPQKEDRCLKIPDTSLFLAKYKNLLSQDASAWGYLFHLYTDKVFFSSLFPKTFISLDKEGKETTYAKETVSIKIEKNKKIVNAKEFWTEISPINIYSDYTLMNKMLLENYGTEFNKEEWTKFAKENFINPGITEVSYEKIEEILEETDTYIKESIQSKAKKWNVFKEENIKSFIETIPEEFMEEYKELLDKFMLSREVK